MTNEEKAREIASKYERWNQEDDESYGAYNGAMEMAEWKEKQMLEKAEKWFMENGIDFEKLKQTVMKEMKLEIPADYEVDKVETQDGHIEVTFKKIERMLPKSWEDFCEMFPCKDNEYWIEQDSNIEVMEKGYCSSRNQYEDKNILPDRATAEAILALCQLIQLRNAYNGDWVPDYKTADMKFTIEFENNRIVKNTTKGWPCILIFKSEELRDEFLRNFHDLIEKLKPLYGIKEGGEE